jgi:tetratricopeptide (TPR) repeat protein
VYSPNRGGSLRENRSVAASPSPIVGRSAEREAIAAALADLRAGRRATVVIEGEPGIGKSRLLAHLSDEAASDGVMVLTGRAAEFETDLPYAIWTEALDGHLTEAGERRLSRLGLADPGALSSLLPALSVLGGEPARGDRHRTHRALVDLLRCLAAPRPVVLCLDDVHWADSASAEALAALIRRPASGRVLLALATREGALPASLAAAVSAALREGHLKRLVLAPLSEVEAKELVGEAAAAIYTQSGGNPFYLEQLARSGDRAGPEALLASDGSVPGAVAAALAGELAGLTPDARRQLDGAAVAGDPFEAGLASEVAELSEAAGLAALDELLQCALVRPAGAPRLFAFRHPVVRHAVYAAAPSGWRLGAHARAARALERTRAGPVARAHHVEQAARPGDAHAIDLLATAAQELQSPAPAAAARFQAAVLRLLPDRPENRERRIRALGLLADAQSAAGDPIAARESLLEALRTAEAEQRLRLVVAVANAEWWLGRDEEARRRLHVALGDLPAQPSPDRIRLRLALTLIALEGLDLDEARAQASDARDDARAIGDPVFEAAALAGGGLARVTAADGLAAERDLDESSAALERLSGEQLATRLPALWMHGRGRHVLGQFEAALEDFDRGIDLAAQTGRMSALLLSTVESVQTLVELGRLEEACARGEEGLERARLAGIPRVLVWAHSALSTARLATGDVQGALREAFEGAETGVLPGFYAAGQPGWCLGAALTAAGNHKEAVEAMTDAFGGAALGAVLPVQRPFAAADLVEAHLARGDLAAAELHFTAGLERNTVCGLRPVVALMRREFAELLLAAGDKPRATALLHETLREAEASGMSQLISRVRVRLDELEPRPTARLEPTSD